MLKYSSSRPKRNYQFIQFILDLFALFLLYILIAGTVDAVGNILMFNREVLRATDEFNMNPYPLIVWSVLGLLVYVSGFVIPLIYKNKSKLNQRQYDMWVYAVLLIRIVVIVQITCLLGVHKDIIMRVPNSVFNMQTLFEISSGAVLIAILVRFTQIRIRAAATKSKEKKRTIMDS